MQHSNPAQAKSMYTVLLDSH